MYKHFLFIRSVIFITCLLTLLWGCEKQGEQPKKSREITKKITIIKKKTVEAQPPKKMGISKSTSIKEAVTPITKAVTPLPKPGVTPKNQKTVASLSSIRPKIEKPETSDLYNIAGKLDPFEPLFQKEPVSISVSKKKAKRRTPLTPLERVDLSQLKLVGIILAPSGNRALVEETSGKGYVVKKGTRIGTHSGKIVEILKDRVVIEEEVEDMYGKVSMVKQPLKLQKTPGE